MNNMSQQTIRSCLQNSHMLCTSSCILLFSSHTKFFFIEQNSQIWISSNSRAKPDVLFFLLSDKFNFNNRIRLNELYIYFPDNDIYWLKRRFQNCILSRFFVELRIFQIDRFNFVKILSWFECCSWFLATSNFVAIC